MDFPTPSRFMLMRSLAILDARFARTFQDPYHDIGQAQGLSFSVPTGKKLPSSLRNIYKEISEDIGCPMPKDNGCLEPWAHQGVLMLNSVLTVEAHKAASHSKRGWEDFTTHTVRTINRERNGIVFMLWGKYAQEKGSLIDTKRHHVLKSPHPRFVFELARLAPAPNSLVPCACSFVRQRAERAPGIFRVQALQPGQRVARGAGWPGHRLEDPVTARVAMFTQPRVVDFQLLQHPLLLQCQRSSPPPPLLFISYCHTSQNHQSAVLGQGLEQISRCNQDE